MRNSIENFRNSTVKKSTAAALSALVLVGCNASRQDIREEIMDPVTRVDYDFGGSTKYNRQGEFGTAESGNNCLVGTPYDPITTKDGSGNSALVTTEEVDERIVATLTPASSLYPDAEPLRLVGFEDFENFLLPADDEVSQRIFNDYGCFEE